jgi:oligoribonuclease NrnB/cAMP/cGMP phosphodiesterase (DHH superfamily)
VATERTIHIVSHGPHCLDGVAAAVAVARFHEGDRVIPQFSGPPEVDGVLRAIDPVRSDGYELWITDISWREAATDDHLRALAERGVRIYWFDHHRTAINRYRAGGIRVPFAGHVVSDEVAASQLVYDYLSRRLLAEGGERPRFQDLAHLVALADDNDRWLHRLPGSRTLALVVRALGEESYEELLHIGADVAYTPRMAAAERRLEAELTRTFQIADATRTEQRMRDGTVLVAAVCDGHASEVADRWGRKMQRAVFALFDAKSLTVSLRRSPDCDVDLSRLAERLGGGGHAAAAGCELTQVRDVLAKAVGTAVAAAIDRDDG